MLKTTKKIMLAMLTRLGGHGHLGGLSKCGSREQMVKASVRECRKRAKSILEDIVKYLL